MLKYVFEVANHPTELWRMSADTVRRRCDGHVSNISPLEAHDYVQSNLLSKLTDVGADYEPYIHLGYAHIHSDAGEDDKKAIAEWISILVPALGNSVTVNHSSDKFYVFVCPCDTKDDEVITLKSKLHTMLAQIRCVSYRPHPHPVAEVYAQVTLPADFANRFLRMRYWTFKEAVAAMTQEEFANTDIVTKIVDRINPSDADMVWYNGKLMTIHEFVRNLDGITSLVVNFDKVLCIE